MQVNRILAALDPQFSRALTNSGRQVRFAHGDLLTVRGAPIREIIFPVSGMVSLVVDFEDGGRVEAAMVGNAGALGGAALLGAKEHITTALGQMPGWGWAIPVDHALGLAQDRAELKHLLFRHEQFVQVQAQQTAACSSRHGIQQRLASWLMRARSILTENDLFLTQEHIAEMLGVQRATISVAASLLGNVGAIQYRRGRIAILDDALLANDACNCHHAIADQQRRLFDQSRGVEPDHAASAVAE